MSVAIICQPMLILSLDTTTRAGSCALLRDDRVVREQIGDGSRDQAERLPRDLAALLERDGVALPDVDAFAVATGPGSFTGLRVGIATQQGLAMAMQKPLIGVSAFDALAFLADSDAHHDSDPRTTTVEVATWIDAWRGEVFAARYASGVLAGEPVVALPEALLARLEGRPTLFTGDGAALYESRIRAELGNDARFAVPIAPALAGAVATLAGRMYRAGERPLPHAIRPIYVRRSDAELAADRRAARR
jgi:tRNA threonylcarbamoyladenosine biosynthesis protein TsaB